MRSWRWLAKSAAEPVPCFGSWPAFAADHGRDAADGSGYAHNGDGIASRVVYCWMIANATESLPCDQVPENLWRPLWVRSSRFQMLSGGLERAHVGIASKFGLDERYFNRLAGNLMGGTNKRLPLESGSV